MLEALETGGLRPRKWCDTGECVGLDQTGMPYIGLPRLIADCPTRAGRGQVISAACPVIGNTRSCATQAGRKARSGWSNHSGGARAARVRAVVAGVGAVRGHIERDRCCGRWGCAGPNIKAVSAPAGTSRPAATARNLLWDRLRKRQPLSVYVTR